MIFIVPVTMIICGAWLKIKPPKKRNRWSGYRTKESMKSQTSWDFAQQYCGKIWLIFGLLMLAVCIPAILFIKSLRTNTTAGAIIAVVQSIILCLTIVPVEKKLKHVS